MNKENAQKLYDALSKKYNLGDFNKFCTDIADEKKRKKLFDAASKKYDFGDFNKFNSQLGFGSIPQQQSFSDVPENLTVQQMDSISNAENARFGTELTTSDQQQPQEEKGFWERLGDKINDVVTKTQQGVAVGGGLAPTQASLAQERKDAQLVEDAANADRKAYAQNPYLKDDIALTNEDVKAGKYKPKEEKDDQDIFDNQSELYRRTPDGEAAYNKMTEQVFNIQKQYADQFAKSDEFRKLQEQYQQQLNAANGDDAKAEITRRFNELLNKRLEERYGADMDEKCRNAQAEYFESLYKARQQSFDGARERLYAPIVREKNENLRQSVFNELTDVRKQISDKVSALSGNSGYPSTNLWSQNAAFTNMVEKDNPELANEKKMLETAQNRLEDNKKLIDAAVEGKGFWAGLGNTAGDFDNWTMGLSEYYNSKNVRAVLEKADKGEELTKAEQAVMDAVALETMAHQYYAYQLSRMYKAGETTGASLPFMVDFTLNPFSGVGRALAKTAMKWGVKRGLAKGTRYAAQIGARLGGDILGATGMTLTTGAGRVAAGVEQRMTGDVMSDISYDRERGAYDINYKGRENQQTFGTALWNSTADNWIENYSEMALGVFDHGGKVVKGWVKNSPMNGLFNTKGAEAFKYLWQGYDKLQKRAQFHGYLGEVSEEYFGNVMRLAATTDTKAEDVFSADAQIDTWLGLAPTSVAFALLGMGGRGINKYNKYKAGKESYADYLSRLTPEERTTFDIVQQHIEDGDTDFAKDYVKKVVSDYRLTPQQKQDRLQAVYATLYNKQYADFKGAMADEIRSNLDALYRPRVGSDGKLTFAFLDGNPVSVSRQNDNGSYHIIDANGNESDVDGSALTDIESHNYDEFIQQWTTKQLLSDIVERRFSKGDKITNGEYEGEIADFDGNNVTLRLADNSTTTIPYSEIEEDWGFVEDKKMESAAAETDKQTNETNGHVTNIRIGGESATFYVKSGNLAVTTNSDGKPVIDKGQSDKVFTVVNAETGEAMQVGIERIAEVVGDATAQEIKEQSNEAIRQASYNERNYPTGAIVYNEQMPNGLTSIVSTDENGIGIQSLNEQTGQIEQTNIPNEQRNTWRRLNLEQGNILQTQVSTIEIIENKGADGYIVSIDGAQPQQIGAQQLADKLTAEQFDVAAYEAQYGKVEQEQEQQQAPQAEQTEQQPEQQQAQQQPQAEQQEEGAEFSDEDVNATVTDIFRKLQKQKELAAKPISLIDEKAVAKREAAKQEVERLQQLYDYWNSIKQRRDEQKTAAAKQRKAEDEAERQRREAEKAAQAEAERIEREKAQGVPDVSRDNAADARKRGYRIESGRVIERQLPVKGIYGNSHEVMFSTKDKPLGRVKVVEAGALQPSHINGARNNRYFITEAQPKERTDKASQMAAEKIAQNIIPQQITEGTTAYQGAPVINTRGEVIQGNNRTTALRKMYDEFPEQAAIYKQYLIDNADKFGLNANEIAAMEKPVLTTELNVSDEEAIRLGQKNAQDTESGGRQRIDSEKTAQMLGDKLYNFAQRLTQSNDEEMPLTDVIGTNGKTALKYLNSQGIINETQYQSAFDKNGNLTPEAKSDLLGVLENMLFAGAKSDRIKEMFSALPQPAQKAILQTIARDAENSNDAKVAPYLQEAIEAYYSVKDDEVFLAAKTLDERMRAIDAWARQSQMDFAGNAFFPVQKYSNFALALAATFKSQTMATQRAKYNELYDKLQGKGANLFGEAETLSFVEAVERVYNIKLNRENKQDVTNDGSNVLAHGSKPSSTGQPRSAGGTRSTEPTAAGERTADHTAGTATDNEQSTTAGNAGRGRGNTQNTSDTGGRQQHNLGEEYELSDEIDENGQQFVLNSKGKLEFGKIDKESGLQSLPILLSEGIITDPATNAGYGLVHINARHGDQIRKAGYSSIVSFVEDVAKNYEKIKEGKNRNGERTYLLQLTDKHNNTLIVELSSDGTYWNVNTAGIFRNSYGNGNVVYERHATNKQPTETVAESLGKEQSSTTQPTSIYSATQQEFSSTDKDTTNNRNDQTFDEKKDGGVQIENEQKGITPIQSVDDLAARIDETLGDIPSAKVGYLKALNLLAINKEASKEFLKQNNITTQDGFAAWCKKRQAKLRKGTNQKRREALAQINTDRILDMAQKAESEFEQRVEAENREKEQKRTNAFVEKMTGKGVNLVQDARELPRSEGTAYRAIKSGAKVMGWFNVKTGQVYIYTPNANNHNEVMRTLLHEFVSHKGLRDMLGTEAFDKLCHNVWKMMPFEQRVQFAVYVTQRIPVGTREIQKYIEQLSPYEIAKLLGSEKTQLAAADEYMAHFAEKGVTEQNRSIWQQIADAIRKMLRKIGFDVPLQDSDIARLLYESKNRLTQDMTLEEMAEATLKLNTPTNGFSTSEQKANDRFNAELQEQIDGTLPSGHIYQLGMPSNILRSAGIPSLPIELAADRLKDKSTQENHPFQLSEVRNLPQAINNPIAVFDSSTHKKDDSKVIFTELKSNGNNFVVIMRVRTAQDNSGIEVNDIRSLYPKDHVGGVRNWVEQGLLRYADKKKLVGFLTQSTNLIGGKETDYNSLDSTTKIVQNFENPKLSNDIRFSIEQATQILSEGSLHQSKRYDPDSNDDIRFSITKRNEATIDNLLAKNKDISEQEAAAFKQFVDEYPPVAQLSMARWYGLGNVRLPEDKPLADQALKICNKTKKDPMSYASPGEICEEWRKQHSEPDAENRQLLSPEAYPDVLTNKTEYSNGIVVYDVENSKRGQQAVRDLMNDHLGKEVSPWCLLYANNNGELTDHAWDMWKHYNATQKKVALYKGQVVSFCASDGRQSEWWDLSDQSHGTAIPIEDKIPNDKMGRSALLEYDPQTGETERTGNMFLGNKKEGKYYEWDADGRLLVEENYKHGKRDGEQKYWRENGQLQAERNYKDGNLDGREREWHENGQLYSEQNFKNDLYDGVQKYWHENGQLRSEYNYKHGRLNGTQKHWYENGRPEEEANYKDDKLDGIKREWYENGRLYKEQNLKDDKRDGVYRLWYDNGQLKEESNYKDSRADGVWKTWFENGQLQTEQNYKDGKREGVRRSWDYNGVLYEEKNYKDDNLDGTQRFWGISGQGHSEENWKNGKLDGVQKEWYDNGQLKAEENFKDGQRDGVQRSWYENGQLEYEENYKNGVIVETDNDTRFSISSYAPEQQSIRDKAVANGTYMKAPNGKPSRLTERQWLQVRTQAFKKWFGDWEKAAQAKYLLGDNYVKVLAGTEFQKDETPITKKVAQYYNEKYDGHIERKNFGEVILDERSVKDSIAHGIGRTKSAAFAAVPEIIRDGIEIDTQENWKGRNRDSFTFAAPVEIGEKAYVGVVIVTRGTAKGDNRFYLHEVILQENLQSERIKTDNKADAHNGDIAKVLKNIISASENCSKVVDENGEPLVVYHRTASKFWKFDPSKARQSSDIPALFFSSGNEDWEAMGERVVPAFLNIRKIAEKPIANGKGREVLDALKSKGYDGTIVEEAGTETEYAVFSPNQIKSATDNNGSFDENNDDIRFSISNASNDIFYSNAERAVENIKQEKATPQQWLAMIEKNGGLKAGEDKWIGLSDWLKEQDQKTLTKQEVIDFIRSNKIQIEETHYSETTGQELLEEYQPEFTQYYQEAEQEGADDPQEAAWQRMIDEYGDDFGVGFYAVGRTLYANEDSDYLSYLADQEGTDRPINETRLEYSTKGLENKHEIALTVPTIESWDENDLVHFGDADNGRAVAWVRFGDTTIDADATQQREAYNKLSSEWNAYRDMLHGKYGDTYSAIAQNATEAELNEYDRLTSALEQARDAYMNHAKQNVLVIDEIQSNRHQQGREKGYQQKGAENATDAIPAAPFEKNWHELAMKRILRFAAENGYHKLAWTTGAQQAIRYDVGRNLESVEKTGEHAYTVRYKEHPARDFEFDENGIFRDEYYPAYYGKTERELFGKEFSEKLAELPVGETIDGDNLMIGGEGMKGFYDDMLPRFMQKYGKKWGVQVGEVTMPKLQKGYQTMHAIDINDAMRESVMAGQPMFRIASNENALTEAGNEIESANAEFNQRLDELIANPTQKDRVLHLGRASQFLKDGGISDAEIILDYDRLVKKAEEAYENHHPFELKDVKDLPKAISEPIAVFYNTNNNGHNVVLTELQKDGNNFIVAIETQQKPRKGGVVLEINEIITLFPKDARGIVNWFNVGNATNIDKEKALRFIEALRNHRETTITSEELNSATKVVKDFENPKFDDDSRFSIIGERGAANLDRAEEATTRMDNLQVAREMEQAGKDAKAIRLATGWERGADGKWRYEIPDAKIIDTLDIDGTGRYIVKRYESDMLWNSGRLGDKVVAPELFAAYPQLKTYGINTDTLTNGWISNGDFDHKRRVINIHANELKYLNSILNHEIQHAIQRIEGFAIGGNEASVEVAFKAAKAEWKARAYAHALEETAKELGGEYNQAEVEKALIREYEDMGMQEYLPDNETRVKGFNYFARGYADRSMDDAIKRFRLETSTREDFNAYNEYRHLSGEVEARNAQKRMAMDEFKRKRTLLRETEDVAREDQIFLYDSLTSPDLARAVNPNEAVSAEAENDIRFSIDGGVEGSVAPEALPQELVENIAPSESITDFAIRLNATMNGYTQERTQQMYDEVEKRMRKGGRWYAKLYKHLYDKYRPLDRLQKMLAKQGALLNVQTDAYNDIFRSIGRASTAFEEFYDKQFKPLIHLVRKLEQLDAIKNFDDVRWADGKKMTDHDKLTLYLRAKDMVEAAELGLVERGAEGFADMVRHNGFTRTRTGSWTPQEYVEAFEAALGEPRVNALWGKVNAINKWSLDYMRSNDFIDDETLERYKDRKFYVPQRGFEEGESKPAHNGRGSNNFGSALRKAHGRESLAADPLVYMANIAESTIMATQKNKTKQKMLLFCMANMRLGKETGTFDIAKVQYRKTGKTLENGLPEYEPFYGTIPYDELKEDAHNRREIARKKQQLAEAEAMGNVYFQEQLKEDIAALEAKTKYAASVRYDQIRPDTKENISRNRVDVIYKGKKYSLLFADENVAVALNREDPEMGKVTQFLNTTLPFIPATTQYFSRILTQQNPSFALWNLFRDMGLGFHTNLLEHPDWTLAFSKNLVAVQRAVAQKAFANKIDESSKMGKYIQEYFAEGAQTGFSFINSVDDLRKKIAKDLKRSERYADYLDSNLYPFKLFSNITEWSELTVRVAQYVTAREHGYTPEQAATEAKEVSTNFDRKGNLRLLYSLFSFFNAAMQGTNKHIRQVMNGHGVGLALSLALYAGAGLLNTLCMPDDPDDEMGFSEFDRMQNICLGRVRIPLPQGLRGFWALGVQAALAAQGRKTWLAAAVDGASFLAAELGPINPLGGLEVDNATNRLKVNSKLAFREFVPTAAQPFYDVANNTTFNGSTVYRKPYVSSQEGKIPQTNLAKRNVNALLQRATDKWFELGGGDPSKNTLTRSDGTQVRSVFDVNPSKVEYLLKSATGGVGQFAVDLVNTIDNALTKNINSFDDFATTMPVVKRAWKPYKEEKEATRAYWLLKGRVEAASKAATTMPQDRKLIYLKAKNKLGQKSPADLSSKEDLKEMNDIIVEWNKNYW